MKKYIILLLTAFMLLIFSQESSAKTCAAENDTIKSIFQTLPLKEYQQDFNKMVDLLLETHPQPNAFTSKDSIENLINIQYHKINDSTTLGRFLWICQEVVAAVNCGHTWIWSYDLNNLPKSVGFPLNVKYVGSKLYIIDAKNNSNRVSAGNEILTINGVKVETLQKEIFKHLPSDGFNESNKHENTNLLFSSFCAMYFDFPTSYTVSVHKDRKTDEIKLEEGENFEPTKTFLDDCENRLCFDTNVESNTAIITIRSFAYYGKDLPIFKSFIDSCFNQIKENEIENLIIDLRNNGGGDPFCGSYLIQYIADKSYTYFHKDVWVHANLKKTIHPIANGFKNKPYILTNGLCFSTTGHFCSIVKENNFGILIGDETGGTYTCNDNSKIHTLENTKLLLKVARSTYYTSASTFTNKQGIIPDYYVIPGIDDILINSDTVLNYTLKLIEKE